MKTSSSNVTFSASAKPSKKAAVVVFVGSDGKLMGDQGLLDKAAADAAKERGKLLTAEPGDVSLGAAGSQAVMAMRVAGDEANTLRKAGGQLARAAKKYAIGDLAVLCPSGESAEHLATGLLLGNFEFSEYAGSVAKARNKSNHKLKVALLGGDKKAAKRGEALGIAQNYARTVATRPGNDINPPSLAKEAQKLARAHSSLSCKVIDDKQAKQLKMGGLIGVGQGSNQPPRMIVLEYNKPKGAAKNSKKKPLLVVGKAITFDTGGLSLKPTAGMVSMMFDKCGGMAVLGMMAALAEMGVNRHVVGILAAAENSVSDNSYRPGDILTMYNGVTVEITNTDAEGRLVLADALTWGIETYKPAACVDLATLTGGCVVALGHHRAGAWCNDDALFESLQAASDATGENIWRMPLGDDYREMLKSNVADILNSPGRYGSSDTAAEFLHHFIPGNVEGKTETPWCHLDIAGTATADKPSELFNKGATGYGVRLLVEWVEQS